MIPHARHECTLAFEKRETPKDSPLCGVDGLTHDFTPTRPAVPLGTVRACGECGKTWVARRHYSIGFVNEWLPEGRLARWWRERDVRA